MILIFAMRHVLKKINKTNEIGKTSTGRLEKTIIDSGMVNLSTPKRKSVFFSKLYMKDNYIALNN